MPQRLAKPVYESLPLLWALAGVACLGVSWWRSAASWSGFVGLAGLALLTFGIAVWMHRRDYRRTAREYQLRGRPVAPPAEGRDERR